ncbi:HAD-IB family phosphatase [Pseudomonas fluorescens]|uniref:phosphoserine phosphatase n=1 Tax=Pseudomonas fluorescens TaxID=294 RepID=A0AAE2U899_PSEFL|nr:HAD-IB family phosphatase [Pseudomonas fluorescens]MBD8272558.1 HAD-IB family phosphatase [Pseudomonas fluorescens]
MTTTRDTHVIFDFDQTLVNHESTLEIVKSAIGESPNAKPMLEQLQLIAPKALSGNASLWEMVAVMKMIPYIRKHHIQRYVDTIIGSLDPSLEQTVRDLQRAGTHVYILSGGYTECITPIARSLNIQARNVIANRLFWVGSRALCPRPSPLINPGRGKSRIVQQWRKEGRLTGRALIVGDARSDYQVYADGWVDGFVCADYYTRQPMPEMSGRILRADTPIQLQAHIHALMNERA